jgi:hypothetical protein
VCANWGALNASITLATEQQAMKSDMHHIFFAALVDTVQMRRLLHPQLRNCAQWHAEGAFSSCYKQLIPLRDTTTCGQPTKRTTAVQMRSTLPASRFQNRIQTELNKCWMRVAQGPISPSLLHPVNPKPHLTQTLNLAASHLDIHLGTSMLIKSLFFHPLSATAEALQEIHIM